MHISRVALKWEQHPRYGYWIGYSQRNSFSRYSHLDRSDSALWIRVGRSARRIARAKIATDDRADPDSQTRTGNQFRWNVQMGLWDRQRYQSRGTRIFEKCWRPRPRNTSKFIDCVKSPSHTRPQMKVRDIRFGILSKVLLHLRIVIIVILLLCIHVRSQSSPIVELNSARPYVSISNHTHLGRSFVSLRLSKPLAISSSLMQSATNRNHSLLSNSNVNATKTVAKYRKTKELKRFRMCCVALAASRRVRQVHFAMNSPL